jgi:integrase
MHLNAPALEVLAGIEPEEGNPFVVPGGKPGTHLVNLKDPWRRLRRATGLDDLRLHDLRHCFASVAAGIGLSLPMIGKLLGHTQAATTQRYVHLAADPVREATERVGAQIATVLEGRAGASKVVAPEVWVSRRSGRSRAG